MSRHGWNGSRAKPDQSPSAEPEAPYLGIFAATLRAVRGLTGRPTPPTQEPVADPVPADGLPPGEAARERGEFPDLPVPRATPDSGLDPASTRAYGRPTGPALGVIGSPQPVQQPTADASWVEDTEPTEPALSMLPRGRHGLW